MDEIIVILISFLVAVAGVGIIGLALWAAIEATKYVRMHI